MSMEWMKEWYPHAITFVLDNFALSMLCVAAFFMLLHRLITWSRVTQYEIVYRWTAFFAVGLTGIYTCVMHAFFPVVTAAAIGWATSPFQYEVAVADFAIGILAIFSFNASYSFRLATVIAVTCWLWGVAGGHVYQMVMAHDYAIGNAGTWLWMDILLPLILIVCINKMKSVNPCL